MCGGSRSSPPPSEVKITPWDGPGMKRTLDDNLGEVFCEVTALQQDTRWFDFKLAIMVIACLSGLIAQFYPLPFPDNRWILLACFVVYFLLSGLLQSFTWFVDRDYVIQTVRTDKTPPIFVRTAMDKFDDIYKVIIESPAGKVQKSTEFSVGKIFCADGRYSKPHFAKELRDNFLGVISDLADKKGK